MPPRRAARAAGDVTDLRSKSDRVPVSAQQPATAPATAASPSPAVASFAADLGAAGKKALDDAVFGKRPYLRAAFFNPYNLSLLGGGLAASALTVNPFLAIATLGYEAIWLLNAPDSQRLR